MAILMLRQISWLWFTDFTSVPTESWQVSSRIRILSKTDNFCKFNLLIQSFLSWQLNISPSSFTYLFSSSFFPSLKYPSLEKSLCVVISKAIEYHIVNLCCSWINEMLIFPELRFLVSLFLVCETVSGDCCELDTIYNFWATRSGQNFTFNCTIKGKYIHSVIIKFIKFKMIFVFFISFLNAPINQSFF